MRSIADIFRSHAVFDSQGRHVNGTDKESNHRYGDAYESLFSERLSTKLMMEVGVADGSSLLAWSEVFPNATCVGMDIHHSEKAHGPRIEFHKGDQRCQEDCERATAGRQFDIIVEDASHRLEDSLLTLLYLWPFVGPGGIYVVEELSNIGALRYNVSLLFGAAVVDTHGPFGGIEPLVVMRKRTW